jgi:hypothetical protein
MLMAWAESIIAEQVTTNIFRTTWLPPDSPLHDLFDAISNQLAIESPDKEAWWRSLTCDATQKLDWKILPFMCAKLRFIFKPLFKDNPTMLDEFLGRLDKFFCQCIDFWTCALHSERKVIAVLSSDPMDGEYHTDEHDIEVSPQEIRQNRSRVGRALPLFPGFGILDGANSTILLRGKSLPPSAPSAVRSRAEHWEIQNTLFNRVRERRDSDAVDEPSAIVPFSATQTTAFSWPSATDTPFSPTQGIVPTWPASAGANIVPNSPRAPPSHTTRQMPMSGAPGSGGVGLFNNSNGTGAERGR